MKRNYFRIFIGIVPCILIVGLVSFYSSADDFQIFMSRELAKKHAPLERRCKVCHIPWNGVNNRSCLKCHHDECEKYYSLVEDNDHSVKIRCFNCHGEHMGRLHDLVSARK
jgi:hypothetical protein